MWTCLEQMVNQIQHHIQLLSSVSLYRVPPTPFPILHTFQEMEPITLDTVLHLGRISWISHLFLPVTVGDSISHKRLRPFFLSFNYRSSSSTSSFAQFYLILTFYHFLSLQT